MQKTEPRRDRSTMKDWSDPKRSEPRPRLPEHDEHSNHAVMLTKSVFSQSAQAVVGVGLEQSSIPKPQRLTQWLGRNSIPVRAVIPSTAATNSLRFLVYARGARLDEAKGDQQAGGPRPE